MWLYLIVAILFTPRETTSCSAGSDALKTRNFSVYNAPGPGRVRIIETPNRGLQPDIKTDKIDINFSARRDPKDITK